LARRQKERCLKIHALRFRRSCWNLTVKLSNTKELEASSSNPFITGRNKSSVSLLSSPLTVSHFFCLRHKRDVADEARTRIVSNGTSDVISVAHHYFQVFYSLLCCFSLMFKESIFLRMSWLLVKRKNCPYTVAVYQILNFTGNRMVAN